MIRKKTRQISHANFGEGSTSIVVAKQQQKLCSANKKRERKLVIYMSPQHPVSKEEGGRVRMIVKTSMDSPQVIVTDGNDLKVLERLFLEYILADCLAC